MSAPKTAKTAVTELDAMNLVVYKFLPAEYALKALEERKLKVSLISELNDIYDCAPIVRRVGDGLRHTHQNVSKEWFNRACRTFGLLCFSACFQSPLLWGHYASSATGLALGFSIEHLARKSLTGALSYAVEYDRRRPRLEYSASDSDTDDDACEHIRAYFAVKAKEWEYEQEFRQVVFLPRCEPRAGMYFAPFDGRALKEVIIGCRSSITPSYVSHCLQRHYKDLGVSVYTAKVHPSRYEMTREPFPKAPPETDRTTRS
jgi:Protein of unknown function (DUF2971)